MGPLLLSIACADQAGSDRNDWGRGSPGVRGELAMANTPPADSGASPEDSPPVDTGAPPDTDGETGETDSAESTPPKDTAWYDTCSTPWTGADTAAVPVDTGVFASEAAGTLYGDEADGAGVAVRGLPDLDGDGLDDLLVLSESDAWVRSSALRFGRVREGALRWPAGASGILGYTTSAAVLPESGAYGVTVAVGLWSTWSETDAVVATLRPDADCGATMHVLLDCYEDHGIGLYGEATFAGDTTGDGIDDLLVYAYWAPVMAGWGELVRLIPGPLDTQGEVLTAGFGLGEEYCCTGPAVGLGDTDGDGIDDVVVSTASGLLATLFRGPIDADRAPSSADSWNQLAAVGVPWVGAPGDVDGDGLADVGFANNGTLYLAPGAVSGEWDADDVLATVTTPSAGESFGAHLASVPGEALVIREDPAFGQPGLWFARPPFAGTMEVTEGWKLAHDDAVYGMAVDRDLDGDGLADLLLGVPDAFGGFRGAVYQLSGDRW